jgi:S-adenosylmethionine:tRNA ribosyltransferase-isomerase
MKTTDFDYELPLERIAQTPLEPRDSSRLFVYDRKTGKIDHSHFYNLSDFLYPGDLLVLNQTRVLPARIYARKDGTGGLVEVLLLRRLENKIGKHLLAVKKLPKEKN